MARQTLTINALGSNAVDSISPQTVVAVDGAKFVNDGLVGMLVENSSGGPVDITFVTGLEVEGFTVEDLIETIPAGERRWCSRFTTSTFNQTGGDAGSVYVDVTDDLDITAFALS